MALVGNKTDNKALLRGYEQDPMHEAAAEFVDLLNAAKQESGIGLFEDPTDFLRNTVTSNELKKYFVENSYAEDDNRFVNNPAALNEHLQNMEALFENDADMIMTEAANLGNYSPVIGMALPIHKNILMNAVFDQVMPKDVARSPKFTLTMETRTLVDVQGNEYDMFVEQNQIKDAVERSIPTFDHVVSLPENEQTDWMQLALDAGYQFDKSIANLSMRTEILGVVIGNVYVKTGEPYYDVATQTEKIAEADGPQYVLFKIHAHFTPGYGMNNRQMNHRFMIEFNKDADGNKVRLSNTIFGYMTEKNRMMLTMAASDITDAADPGQNGIDAGNTKFPVWALVVRAVLDVSTAIFPTVKVKWSANTSFYEIPEAPHITIPISPEEVKDIQALYDINQVTKYMSMMRLVLLHWKDDMIHDKLDESYACMPAQKQYKVAIDWAPPLNFAGFAVDWRARQFMDRLDIMITEMLQELNDENMTIAVFGRPDIIRRIAPQQYIFQTPSNIGPVELDFQRTVTTSEHRVYNFISTQKMRNNNNLIILLIPRNSMRITYKIIDYQMYLSNEIRDTKNYQLPSMTAFERWYFLQYQPVQGRCQILNVTGLRENPQGKDYIGTNAMNDYTANAEYYASEVNGVVDAKTGHFNIPPIQSGDGQDTP